MILTIITRIYRYFLLTLLSYIGVLVFLLNFSLVPLAVINKTFYRKVTGLFYVYLWVPGFLCIPFSWMNNRLYANGFDRLRESKGKDQLILSNHNGRVDWLFGLYMGYYNSQRIGFITEAFLMWLPFVGWHRYLIGDMFVYRSFKRDKERLLNNINSFQKSNINRWVFLCPEGYIADFTDKDKEYIEDCGNFCKQLGFEPFKMILTPRYKGMQCFTKLCKKNKDNKTICHQGTSTYVQNGKRLVQPLRTNTRVVPDLWTIVHGNLYCYAHFHSFILSNEPQDIKKQLMTDYSLQDKSLYQFYKTGRYPEAHPDYSLKDSPEMWKPRPLKGVPFISQDEMDKDTGADTANLPKRECSHMQRISPNHLQLNICFFLMLFGSIYVYHVLGIVQHFPMLFIGLFCMISFSHLLGETLSNGQSRESLPFESIFKSIVLRMKGIEGNTKKE